MTSDDPVDFFVSHAGPDSEWAAWVDHVLRAANKTTITDLYDFRAGENFVVLMDRALARADRLLLIWSSSAKDRYMVETEWTNALATRRDRIIPIIVDGEGVPPLLRATIHVDLSDTVDGDEAAAKLLEALEGRPRPVGGVRFPRVTRSPRFPQTPERSPGPSPARPSVSIGPVPADRSGTSLDDRFRTRRGHESFPEMMATASDIWLMAKGFDSFLHDYAHDIEERILSGARFRFLMHNPGNSALMRMMASTSLSSTDWRQVAQRLKNAVQEIKRLGRASDRVQLRLARWPLTNGYSFFDPNDETARVYLELFGYKVSLSDRRAVIVEAAREPDLYSYHHQTFIRQWLAADVVDL